jgi:hypothetical protein
MDGTLVLLVAPSIDLAVDRVPAGDAPVLPFAPSSELIVGRVLMLPFTLSFMLTSGYALIWDTSLLLALQSTLVVGTLVLFAPSKELAASQIENGLTPLASEHNTRINPNVWKSKPLGIMKVRR